MKFASRKYLKWINWKPKIWSGRLETAIKSSMSNSLRFPGNLPRLLTSTFWMKIQAATTLELVVIQAIKVLILLLKVILRWTRTHQLWTAKTRVKARVSWLMTNLCRLEMLSISVTSTKRLKMCLSCWLKKLITWLTTRLRRNASAKVLKCSSKLKSIPSGRVWALMSLSTLICWSRLCTTTKLSIRKRSTTSWIGKKRNTKQPTKMANRVINLILAGKLQTMGKQLRTKIQNNEKSKTKTQTELNWTRTWLLKHWLSSITPKKKNLRMRWVLAKADERSVQTLKVRKKLKKGKERHRNSSGKDSPLF